MIYKRVEAGYTPDRVTLDVLPGRTIIRMTDHVMPYTVETEDSQTGQIMYRFDEAVFDLPDDRSGETVSSITANFAEWWAYADHCHDKTPTADERISDLEDAVMTLADLLFQGGI